MISRSSARHFAATACGCALLLLCSNSAQSQVPYGAGYFDQSEFGLGTYVWNIVFMETPSDPWDSNVLQERKNRILDAAAFWEDEANRPRRFLSNINWLDITVNFANNGVPVVLNNVGGEGSTVYYDEALGILDPSFDSGGSLSSARTYNDAMRDQFGTNWAYTTFVRNFTGRASAVLNGPYTQAYSDDPMYTYAHETGHIFGALDEYSTSGADTGDRAGYLYSYNTNAALNPDGSSNGSSISAIMKISGNFTLSQGTIDAIGWRDTDDDDVPDILDTFPTLSNLAVSSSSSGSVDIDLDAVVTPLPSPNPSVGDFTINKLDSAEYRINGGTWVSLSTVDSAWGDYEESLSFTVAGLYDPINDLELRVRNSVTNFSAMSFKISPNGELPGDANRDGVTNRLDLDIWEANYGGVGPASWDTADFDLNGTVDGRDLLIYQQAVGLDFLTETTGMGTAPSPQQSIQLVPEPSSWALLGLWGMATLAWRRR